MNCQPGDLAVIVKILFYVQTANLFIYNSLN